MMSIYALLSKNSPEVTLNSLQEGLRDFFSRTDEGVFTLEMEENPFDPKETNILLTWNGKWWIRVFYETGASVADDSLVISQSAVGGQVVDIAKIDRRIRVLFADDKSRNYTNHLIFTVDFLQEIPGVIIFDPQKKTFW